MKAIIPAAGLGTRFLPATRVMPKELLRTQTTGAGGEIQLTDAMQRLDRKSGV